MFSKKAAPNNAPDISDLLLLVKRRQNLLDENKNVILEFFDVIKESSHKPYVEFVERQDVKRSIFPNGTLDSSKYLHKSLVATLQSLGVAFILGKEYAEHYQEDSIPTLQSENMNSASIHTSTQNELKRVSEFAAFSILQLDLMCLNEGYADKVTYSKMVDTHISQIQSLIFSVFKEGITNHYKETITNHINPKRNPVNFSSIKNLNDYGKFYIEDLYQTLHEALPEYRGQIQKDIDTLEKWAGVKNQSWTDEQINKFNKQFIIYISERKPELNLLQDKKESLDPAIHEILNRMFNL